MKIVNENLELVDYSEKEKEKWEEKEEKKIDPTYKFLIKMALIDMVYDMNKNLHHKMNFMIITMQILIFSISMILQTFGISTIPISIAGAIGTTVMLCLVFIGNRLSDKAIKATNIQRNMIHECLDKLSERSDESE